MGQPDQEAREAPSSLAPVQLERASDEQDLAGMRGRRGPAIVIALVVLAAVGFEFKRYERISKFALTADEPSIDNGLMTPTLKLKRAQVLAAYAPVIQSLYATAPAAAVHIYP